MFMHSGSHIGMRWQFRRERCQNAITV